MEWFPGSSLLSQCHPWLTWVSFFLSPRPPEVPPPLLLHLPFVNLTGERSRHHKCRRRRRRPLSRLRGARTHAAVAAAAVCLGIRGP